MGVGKPSTTEQSWWWCRHCHAFVDVEDVGEAWPQCQRCGTRKVEHRPMEPTLARATVTVLPQCPAVKTVPIEARSVVHRKRLPAARRDLRVLARTGYWFCYEPECQTVTEKGEDDCCVLCGVALVPELNWNAPVEEGRATCA